jgi:hypothetical protein
LFSVSVLVELNTCTAMTIKFPMMNAGRQSEESASSKLSNAVHSLYLTHHMNDDC